MSVKFLDIAPALPASVALVYVTSFTNVWNHVLPSWINAEASDVQINCKPQMLDEEAKGQNPTSIPDRKSPLEASSFLLHMGHHSLTTTKFFSDDQSCSINACIATAIGAILPQDSPKESKTYSADQKTSESSTGASLTTGEEKEPQRLLVHMHIFSVTALLIFLLDRHGLSSPTGYLAWRRLWIPILLITLRGAIEDWRVTGQYSRAFTSHVQAWIHKTYAFMPQNAYWGIYRPLSAIAPFLICGAMTSFLTSCLGFQYLILGLPRTGPSFRDGGMLGAIVYVSVACVVLVLRGRDMGQGTDMRMWRYNMAILAAFGQTVTGLVGFAGVLFVLKWSF
ncbi:hypothetical protein M438DRAFT_354360 [Aureobasidium pullulans EXF-150]|uniref:Uncharacterized protein n=1 Tax=Aureobasidium pullulans EXF-150 TaxID=1043002 RepID=A0A074XIE2_AURPU|nr:uncharacterized protein M438DRAFT_354360 [Aureobasidium pullulans EXF-150]KEQ85263.1 hypothetical protein M438DRAFT_354360 [Aureobasidium pullulans EXF-150]